MAYDYEYGTYYVNTPEFEASGLPMEEVTSTADDLSSIQYVYSTDQTYIPYDWGYVDPGDATYVPYDWENVVSTPGVVIPPITRRPNGGGGGGSPSGGGGGGGGGPKPTTPQPKPNPFKPVPQRQQLTAPRTMYLPATTQPIRQAGFGGMNPSLLALGAFGLLALTMSQKKSHG